MLAVSNYKYEIPVRQELKDGTVVWTLYRKGNSMESITTDKFTYTLNLIDMMDEKDRISFIYDRASVKLTPRCLRIIGASNERVNDLLKFLATNRERCRFRSGYHVYNDWCVHPYKFIDYKHTMKLGDTE